jgi:DNA-binding NtrC family response regulator
MIIDDNQALAENMKEILEDEGVRVQLADSGLSALAKLEQGEFHLVITDVRMPGMDGVQVIKAIHARWPSLPIIVMTAYSSDASLEEAAASGALEVLSKPINFDQITDMLRRVAGPNAPVLLVEDDRLLRINLTEALLEITNIVPYTAPSISFAERLVREVNFRIAIIDVRLPDGDGFEYGQVLKKRFNDDLQIFHITGYAAELSGELAELSKSAHMPLLEKPFAPARLMELIQSIV